MKSDNLSNCNSTVAKKTKKFNLIICEENGSTLTFQQKKTAERLADTFLLFGVKIEAFCGVSAGPRVTRYEFKPEASQKVSKITRLVDDISLALGVSGIRLICPIPGKLSFGVEVPNDVQKNVEFEEVYSSEQFQKSKDPLCVALGKDLEGEARIIELSRAPHLLIGGQAGTGKTTLLYSMILSLMKNNSSEEVKLLLVSPKKNEFGVFEDSDHLYIPIISDPQEGVKALNELVEEMVRRFNLLVDKGTRDITAYNRNADKPLCRIVVFIDEMSLLFKAAPNEFETAVVRIAQLSRAVGIHLVLATEDTSHKTITGIIKANIPSRIALSVKTPVESRVILDSCGAERLLSQGDMLYQSPAARYPDRIQGAYVDYNEI